MHQQGEHPSSQPLLGKPCMDGISIVRTCNFNKENSTVTPPLIHDSRCDNFWNTWLIYSRKRILTAPHE